MADAQEKFEALDSILTKNIGWISTADSKAGFIFLIATAQLGILAGLLPGWSEFTYTSTFWTITSALLLGMTIIFLVLVNFPQLDGPSSSIIYFGASAKMQRSEYLTKALQGLSDEFLNDMASQCHRNAEIAKYKFDKLKIAIGFLFLALIPWIITLIVLFPNGPTQIL